MANTMQQVSDNGAGGLFTPEALIMFIIAGFVDVGEFFIEFIPVIGTVLSVLLDVFAFFFIGCWILSRIFRGQRGLRQSKRKKMSAIKKFFKVFSPLFEMVPILSSFYPGWLITVGLELKSK